MGTLYLSIELAFDFLAFVMGCSLVFKAKDNYLKLYWGIIAACIGLFFIWENIEWLVIVTDTPEYRFTSLLSIDKMLKWYALASAVSLFPMASLFPGYFNHFRLLFFLFPPIITITIGLCYLFFNGYITPIYTFSEILQNTNKPDIQLRIIIFLISIFLPLSSFIYPLVVKQAFRRINKYMYLFIGFMFLFLGIYITFTLNINEFVFNLFGITALIFTISFSCLYFFRENPFSDHIQMIAQTSDDTINHNEPATTSLSFPLFISIDSYLKDKNLFTDSNFNIKNLASHMNEKEKPISQAIKSGGFTGFREYINYLRLEHFKKLATEYPDKNIKELMYLCGFTSRTTFYRIFSEKFGMSPSQYISNSKHLH